MKLDADPWCELCKARQKYTPAKQVDHIVAVADGGERYDFDNLRSVCRPCHQAKTNRDRRRRTHGDDDDPDEFAVSTPWD